ncbi:MAG: sulfatase-like hydrolase/transferase [Terriglobales bacterium]
MQFFRPLFLIVLLACAGAAATSKPAHPTSATRAKQPNVILITLDTTRADRMGFLGSDRGLTPNLDVLAKQSVVFTRAYAQVPLTTPSHATLLTGTYPQFNRVEDLGTPLAKELPYLPDLLHQRGYHTAAFIGAEILSLQLAPGFDRGFDLYDGHFRQRAPGQDRYTTVERRAEDVANRAMGWLSHHQDGPFFIWLHFYDPHDPYDPPEPFKSHFASAPYDGEIAYTDSVVGSVMEVLQRHGLFEDSVIAVAADHGEAFGEHGEERHGIFLYDETIHVPLLLKLPGERFAGKRVEERVALADVAPSLLEAVGIAVPSAMQGRSLLPLVSVSNSAGKSSPGKKASAERPIYSETNYGDRTFGWAELRSWRDQKYLYVQAPKRELYDQAADPGAVHNVADRSSAIADTLNAQLDSFRKRTSNGQTAPPKLDPGQQEKLKALGYLPANGAAATSSKGPAIDPKDKIEVANKFHRALTSRDEDHYDEAIADLRDVIRLEPDLGSAYQELGTTLVLSGQYAEAEGALRKAVEKMPDSGMAHSELGLLLIRMGQWQPALTELRAAVVCTPGSALFHFDVAAVYTRLKQVPEASVEYEKALELDPDYFEANLTYGRLLLSEGQTDAALAKLTRAVKIAPDSADAHAFLAEAYDKLGQAQNASEERAKAAQLKAGPPQ